MEGKVEESFGPPLEQWKADASPGKRERLEHLVECPDLESEPPGHVCSQLMHRAASAVIEAARFGAGAAVMLIHSFSRMDQWFPEYREFGRLFGIEAEIVVPGTHGPGTN